MLFIALAYLEDPGVIIVIIPFRALLGNIIDRLKAGGINCLEWKAGENNLAVVVVVSANVALMFGFLNYALVLN